MSKLTAVAYYSGIPPNNKNLEKPKILDNFCAGVRVSGDTAVSHYGFNAISCDVALIQGFVHEHGKQAPHLQIRQDAIELQKANNKKSLIVDSNLFLYADKGNTHTYLRYSYDGVFPTTGFYFDKDIDPRRWNILSKNLRLNLQEYRVNGNHILICLQRNGGWSMGGISVQRWLDNTIINLRRYSDRHIVVRLHPGDKKAIGNIKINFKNVKLSNDPNIPLTTDLCNAWATVVYNSSPSVASIIQGVPAFITDPVPQRSQAYDVANKDLTQIETPTLYDRQAWVEKLAMCHWNFEELRSGEAWNFFKRYL